jgi:hypothetical protein
MLRNSVLRIDFLCFGLLSLFVGGKAYEITLLFVYLCVYPPPPLITESRNGEVLFVCMCIPPTPQFLLGNGSVYELLHSFSMRSVSYQMKVGD